MPWLTARAPMRYATSHTRERLDDDPHHARGPRRLLRRGMPPAPPRAPRGGSARRRRAPGSARRGAIRFVRRPRVRDPGRHAHRRGRASVSAGYVFPRGVRSLPGCFSGGSARPVPVLACGRDGVAGRGIPRLYRHRPPAPGFAASGGGAGPRRRGQRYRARMQHRDRLEPHDRQAGVGHGQAARAHGGSEWLGGGVSGRPSAQGAAGRRSQNGRTLGHVGSGGRGSGAADGPRGPRAPDRPRVEAAQAPRAGVRRHIASRRPAPPFSQPRDHSVAGRSGSRAPRAHARPPDGTGRLAAEGGGAGRPNRRAQASSRRLSYRHQATHPGRAHRPRW